jgi:hypothetical protein
MFHFHTLAGGLQMLFLTILAIVLAVNYALGPIIWHLFIEPQYRRKPPEPPPLPDDVARHPGDQRPLGKGMRRLFYG